MFFKVAIAVAAIACASASAQAKQYLELFPTQRSEDENTQKFLESLDYQQGDIALAGASARLNVPNGFYFLSDRDAGRLLVDVWGNPPESAKNVIGMILPASKTPIEDTWGAVLTFDQDGYISDAEAESSDYPSILKSLQTATEDSNEERKKLGYPSIRLMGWASPPYYDKLNHKLHWAKELEFEGNPKHTLNYDVRALGRHGVLKMNFVSGMEQLAEIKQSIPVVMAMPEFTDGAKYSDYIPGADKVAAYGFGGLIAGKAAAKAGLLVIALAFLKKAWILVAFGAVGVLGKLKAMIFGNKSPKA